MTTLLTYDTETTKLVNFNLPSEDPSQPYITELAAKLIDEETRQVLGSMNVLIRPEGYEIPDDVAALNGITTELATRYGVPIAQALEMFIALWRNADMRVAHNESFDMRVLRIAIKRDEVFSAEHEGVLEFADYWKHAPAFCTQGKSVSIINLPPTPKMVAAKRKGPKSPNLGEAYKFFTGRDLVGAHRAMVDVDACIDVYFGIQEHNAQQPA